MQQRTVPVAATMLLVGAALLAACGGGNAAPPAVTAAEASARSRLVLVPGDGEQFTSQSMADAARILRERLDSSGVAGAEVTTEGATAIVVSLPQPPDQARRDLVSGRSRLDFRPVLEVGSPEPSNPAAADASGQPPGASSKASPDSPSDVAYYLTPAVMAEYAAHDCTAPAEQPAESVPPPDRAIVACDSTGTSKYVLGPVEVEGTQIAHASSGLTVGPNGTTTNSWTVTIEFTAAGTDEFRTTTTRLQALTSPLNQFAMVLDGSVLSAPMLAPGVIITDGKAEISGSFTRATAKALAGQIGSGPLPFSLREQADQQPSATSGTS
jgi:preprotein translocase subunit SecD